MAKFLEIEDSDEILTAIMERTSLSDMKSGPYDNFSGYSKLMRVS